MKRVVIFMLLAIGFSEIAVAQKGMQSVGVNIPLNYREKNLSIGIALNYQYNFSDFFRGEFFASHTPIQLLNSYSYLFLGHTTEGNCYVDWQVFINAHFFLFAPRVVRPYIIFGGGIQRCYSDQSITDPGMSFGKDETFKKGMLALNLGLGIDARLSYKWTLQASVLVLKSFTKGTFSDAEKKHGFGAMARVGINYNF